MIFAPGVTDANGTIDLLLPNAVRLRSRIAGIAYTESDTGKSVFAAELKNSLGQLIGRNQVLYPDAFDAIKADVRYTMGTARFEQEVLLKEQLPDPAAYGMNAAKVGVEVWTEFLEAPVPNKQVVLDPATLKEIDQKLDFGPDSMVFVVSQALLEANLPPGMASRPFLRAQKKWVQAAGRTFLIEAVPFGELSRLLGDLPKRTARVGPGPEVLKRLAALTPTEERRWPVSVARAIKTKARSSSAALAKISRGRAPLEPAVVLDYVVVSGSPNYVFQSDTTYSVTGEVNLFGTVTVEGGAVIKYDPVNTTTFTPRPVIHDALNCQTSAYRPAICTARDDDVVGEILPSSTGNPSGSYAYQALVTWIVGSSTDVHDIHFYYAYVGMDAGIQPNVTIRHSQFLNCTYALHGAHLGDFYLRNLLCNGCLTNLFGSDTRNIRAENLTVSQGTQLILNDDSTASFYLTNCLIAAVSNTGGYSGSPNQVLSSISGVFQTVGAGYHYLAAESPYRNAGTASINSQLLTDLKSRTTYPPIVLTTDFNVATILTPQAQRDIDAPDLGYHYDPLDYCFSNLNLTNAVLTLTNSVAVGIYGTNGLQLQTGAVFASQGVPQNLNRLVRYSSVQEQPVLWGPTASQLSFITTASAPSTLPRVSFRFTQISVLANIINKIGFLDMNSNNLLDLLALVDCQIQNVRFSLAPSGDSRQCTLAMTNNLADRATFQPNQQVGGSPLAVNMWNNLFRGSPLNLKNNTNNAPWAVYNNLFDSVPFTFGSVNFANGTNAFYPTASIPGSSGGDIVLSSAPDYLTGPVGLYYYPTSGSGLFRLVNAGSRSAANAGLYHFTVRVDPTKEANTTVDIGFHYVALNGQNLPIDTDGDGLADYFEDANGNGTMDSGETDWNSASDPGLKVIITQPKPLTILP